MEIKLCHIGLVTGELRHNDKLLKTFTPAQSSSSATTTPANSIANVLSGCIRVTTLFVLIDPIIELRAVSTAANAYLTEAISHEKTQADDAKRKHPTTSS
jgi:hypothetical protein